MLILESFVFSDLLRFVFYCFVMGMGFGYIWRSIWQWF